MNQVNSWLIKNNKSNVQIKYIVIEVLKLNGKKKTTVQKFGVRLFLFVPLNANELVLPAPFSEEGGASRAHALPYRQQQHTQQTNLMHWKCQELSSGWLDSALICNF